MFVRTHLYFVWVSFCLAHEISAKLSGELMLVKISPTKVTKPEHFNATICLEIISNAFVT